MELYGDRRKSDFNEIPEAIAVQVRMRNIDSTTYWSKRIYVEKINKNRVPREIINKNNGSNLKNKIEYYLKKKREKLFCIYETG